ncbi:hypothetical protein NSTCB13_00856 [Nostoc sp. DSM 114160]|jgi:hypothetical protein
MNNNMSSDITPKVSQSADPAWDYYLAWHSLQVVKNQIESALLIMVSQEYGSDDADDDMKNLLEPARDKLTEIIENELVFGEHEEE